MVAHPSRCHQVQVSSLSPDCELSQLSEDNSATIPHPPQGLTHEMCAPDVHADLRVVITAWATLSEAVRTTIPRLIQEREVQP